MFNPSPLTPAFGFGNRPPPSSTATTFGTATSQPLFGSTPTPAASAPTFGSALPASSAPAATTPAFGGFNFGAASAAPTSSTPAFGASAATSSTPAFGGFSFGAPPTSSATPAFGSFGAKTTTSTAPAFGGFGTPAATSSAPTFGGFGAAASTSTAPTFGGFGATAPTGTAPTFGGFGTATTSTAPTFGGFGTNTTSMFNSQQQQQLQQQQQQQLQLQQQQQQQPVRNVWQEFALVRAKWDPTSPLCQFRHYFYNLVPANEVHLYQRPANQDEQMWNEAWSNSPDRTCMVPVLAVGFSDVFKRMEFQDHEAKKHKEKLDELSERFAFVQRKHALDTMVKLEEHKRRHADLSQRLIRLLRYIQVIRYKGFPLSNDEEQLSRQLDEMNSLPHNPHILHEKMLKLWTQLQTIKRERESQFNGTTEAWRAINDDDTRKIEKVLEDEQKGLKHIMHVLRKDMEDLETIEAGLRVNAKGKEVEPPRTSMQCT